MKELVTKWLRSADHVIGLVFVGIGVVGLYDTVFGNWVTAGPGYGATFFPQLSFILLIVVGVLFQVFLNGSITKVVTLGDLKALVVLLGSGVAYFQLVRTLGLVTSTFLYSCALVGLLSVKPAKHLKAVVGTGLIATTIVWLLFTRLVDLPLPRPLLF